MLLRPRRTSAILLMGATGCNCDTPEDSAAIAPCELSQPSPYPSSSPYVGLHGNRENNNRVRCAGPVDVIQDWAALQGYAIFQPVTLGPNGDTLYAIAGRTEGCQVFALDTATGEQRWCAGGFSLGVAASTPEVDEDGNIYITDGWTLDSGVGAQMISLTADGQERWRAGLEGFGQLEASAPHRAPAGLHFTPGGLAATVSPDGVVLLVDRADGDVLTAFDIPAATGFVPVAADEPVAYELPQVILDRLTEVVGPLSDEQLDLILGASQGGSGSFSDNTLAITTRNQVLVVGGGPDDQTGALVALDLDETSDPPTLSLRWSMPFAGGSATSPAVSFAGDRVVIGDGASNIVMAHVDACDANTDADPDPGTCAAAWTWPLIGKPILASVALSDEGQVTAWNTSSTPEDADLISIQDTADGPELLWERCFAPQGGDNQQWTSAATALDDVIVGTLTDLENVVDLGLPMPVVMSASHSLVGVDRVTGDVRWSATAPDDSINSPAMGPDGAIYLPMMGMLDLFNLVDDDAFQGGIVRYAP